MVEMETNSQIIEMYSEIIEDEDGKECEGIAGKNMIEALNKARTAGFIEGQKDMKLKIIKIIDNLWCAEVKNTNSEVYTYPFYTYPFEAMRDMIIKELDKEVD